MRRTSVSLPTRNVAHDPHEKAARYDTRAARESAAGLLGKVKAAWMTQSQRSRYLKTGGILLFIVFLFYYLSPGGVDVHTADLGPHKESVEGEAASDPLLSTTKCSQSSDKSKPIVQYALMIDAGSTGSRIHVYRFNNCGDTPELEDEVFKMTEPKKGGSGLSSFKTDPLGAAKSLDVLMDVAMESVPDKLKSCTPVAVKATAGLRFLGTEMSQKILDAVRTRLETVYPFPVVSKQENGVAIMAGEDEGVYAWITTNYLLGNIGGPEKAKTAAVFDLGGGSTQVVFEPNFELPEKMEEGSHKYKLDFGGRTFELYQHSHLGYGLMSARKSIHRALIEDLHSNDPSDITWVSKPIINPCIAPGMAQDVDVELVKGHALGEKVSVNMVGPSSPAPTQCLKLAEKILFKEAVCKVAPCSFNGVHQPSLEKTFSSEDVYTFSYFFDRTDPLGMRESFTLKDLQAVTDQVCGGVSSWNAFESVPGAIAELEDRPEHCLDLNFMLALLHTGYEMPIDREVKIAKKIKGNELGWCLGASLPLLSQSSGWQCRFKEIS
ncbi:Guanosine-diphosphatase-like protein [Venustampulla echinocandica]|uniref:guanosine-diphosphatase n=1 Tax=Venustampulla echinocandica TaxID=2656787 RepID=A0A370TVK4_9HELO|nr:Guanosine-diphosphatase-like protein [Venustampulla echinocandica]RDL39561.1 Guanosine-diphosphatase-like protein [Venustampulla echinocandica]